MNVAVSPGTTHSLNSIMWVLLLIASPGCRSAAWITWVMSMSNGANVLVTRPGAGSAHAHDTKPEQSERYGSQSGTSGRSHVDGQSASLSCSWFGAWQYGTCAS